ncbi:MAG: nucleoside 2-deoxyribosyltransferase [Syntrophobacteraceae bacterium]
MGHQAKLEIFSRCKSHLDHADILIALLDGSQVDDGTAWEIGYFYAKKSPEQKIIGIRTDFRRSGESQGAIHPQLYSLWPHAYLSLIRIEYRTLDNRRNNNDSKTNTYFSTVHRTINMPY